MKILNDTTAIMAARLADITPALKAAPAERIHKKARRSAAVVLGGFLSICLLLGGSWMIYVFSMAAIEQKQPFSISLMLSLAMWLVPSALSGAFVLLRFDNDAGSVMRQIINFLGAIRQAIKPTGAPPAVVVPPPPPEAGA